MGTLDQSDEPHSLGEWYRPALDTSELACTRRHEMLGREANSWAFAHSRAAETGVALHAYAPSTAPVVALCTRSNNRVEVIGSATLLRDRAGPCLVTAAHVVTSNGEGYHEALATGGLAAISLNGAKLVLNRREWATYTSQDVAFTDLTEIEAQALGGAQAIASVAGTASFWVAYGFPRSKNHQSHRSKPLSLNPLRLFLYDPAAVPQSAQMDVAAARAWRIDRERCFMPARPGLQTTLMSLRGCSGGLIGGYYESLGCWLPEAIFTEYHEGARALVACRLDGVFEPQPPVRRRPAG